VFAEVAKTLVVRKLVESQAFPLMVRFAVALVPTPKDAKPVISLTTTVCRTFAEVAKTLVVRKLLENQAFPPTERAFPVAPAPMPMFDVTARVEIFAAPDTFAEVAKTLVVRKLLENQAFPPTVRFADAPALMPMF
jgi:hypothetical protein